MIMGPVIIPAPLIFAGIDNRFLQQNVELLLQYQQLKMLLEVRL